MVTKRAKTVLFTTLTAVMTLPFVVADTSATQVTDVETPKSKLPSDVLLEKDDSWRQKYTNSDEFGKIDKLVRAYVNDTHPNNQWNEKTKKNEIRIYNFDAIAGKKEAGLHALLVNVAEQKTNRTYEPTDAERKFHEWASKRVHNPTKPDVDAKLIEQVIEAYNTNINHGHVPFDLLNEDSDFWGKVMTDTICSLYVECISDAVTDNANGPDCTIIPCADAYHQSAHHYLSISVEPYSCYEGTGCMYTGYTTGTGTLAVSLGGVKHTNTPKLEYTVNLASGTSVYVVATGTLTVGWTDDNIDPVAGVTFAYVSDSHYVNGVTCGSEHCGTYAFVAESNSYIIH